MNPDLLAAIGTIIVTPIITLITLWVRDKNKLSERSQDHEFSKENQLIAVLQKDIDDLKLQVEALNGKLEVKDEEIREIQKRFNAREIDYANLIRDYAQLNDRHQTLQVEHNNLKKQYDDTVTRLNVLTSDHETLKKKTQESAIHMITPTDPLQQ